MESVGNECLTISVDEAARVLGIGRSLCYDMVREGKIPSLRFGNRIVIPRHALERLLSDPNAVEE